MRIKSLKNDEWKDYIGRRVRVLLGQKYDRITGELIGTLVSEEPYKLNIRTPNGVTHSFFKHDCDLVDEATLEELMVQYPDLKVLIEDKVKWCASLELTEEQIRINMRMMWKQLEFDYGEDAGKIYDHIEKILKGEES